MNNYPKMRCPKCGGTIEHDDTYDSYTDDDFVVNFCVGHCVKCESEFQWREEFAMKFNGITDFEEVS